MSNIQISDELFALLIRYHLLGQTDTDTEQAICRGLEAKADAILRRQAYAESKTAATPRDRETARQRYLDLVGMSKDFRW